jgi:hypothetical protein
MLQVVEAMIMSLKDADVFESPSASSSGSRAAFGLKLKCDFLLFKTHLPVVTQTGIRGQPLKSVRVDVSIAACRLSVSPAGGSNFKSEITP